MFGATFRQRARRAGAAIHHHPFTDFARYLLDDPDTRVIAGFVEGFKAADKFLEVAKLAVERGKPIVLIKIGRSELGARAARSHSAALTGADAGTMRTLPNTG